MEEAVVQAAREAGATLQPARIGAGWGRVRHRRLSARARSRRHRSPGRGARRADRPVGGRGARRRPGRPADRHAVQLWLPPGDDGPALAHGILGLPRGRAGGGRRGRWAGTRAPFCRRAAATSIPSPASARRSTAATTRTASAPCSAPRWSRWRPASRTHVRRGAKRPIDTLASVSVWPWEPVRGESESTAGRGRARAGPGFRRAAVAGEGRRPFTTAGIGSSRRRNPPAGTTGTWAIAKRFAHWSERLVAAVRDGSPRFTMPVQVLRVGDIAWVGVGAEVFFEDRPDDQVELTDRPHTGARLLGPAAALICRGAEDYPDGGWDIDARYAVPDLFFQAYSIAGSAAPGLGRSGHGGSAGSAEGYRRRLTPAVVSSMPCTRTRDVARTCVKHLRRELPRIQLRGIRCVFVNGSYVRGDWLDEDAATWTSEW